MTADPGSGTPPMSERMQALLSRAVEDQLSEQRQVAGAMTEVRNSLAQLGADLQQLRATAGGAADEEIQRQVAGVAHDVREAIRVLGERLDAVGGLVQQRGHDLADLRNAIDNELRPRVEAVDASLRDLRGAFTGVGSRVAELPARHELEGMINRAASDTSALDERLESLQGWIEEVHGGVFGDDGVHPRVQALVEQAAQAPGTDEIASQVEQSVRRALAESDERVRPQVEESVRRALAESDERVRPQVEESVRRALAESGDRLRPQIDEAVRAAVAASEQRITEHVDEAVLALAEALLRRRSRTGGVGLSAFDTGPLPVVPAEPEAAAESEPVVPAGPAAEPQSPAAPVAELPAAPQDLTGADHVAGDDHFAGDDQFDPPEAPTAEAALPPAPAAPPAHIDLDNGSGVSGSPFAPATAGAAGGEHADLGDDDDADRRRRPWWRPGD